MHAVIQTGGKQYRVAKGSLLDIDKLPQEANSSVTFDKVLSLGLGGDIKFGTPFVEGASVTATVLKQYRANKIRIIKMKRRKHCMKRMGHRQYLTRVRVEAING